jgi:hypothetical protein
MYVEAELHPGSNGVHQPEEPPLATTPPNIEL